MSDSENGSNLPEGFRDQGEELMARLLRLAGPRAPVPEDAKERVRQAALARWRVQVRSQKRRKTLLWVGVALSAAAVLTVGIGLSRRLRLDGASAPVPSAATLLRLDGSVEWPDAKSHSAGDALPAGTRLRTGPEGRVALRLAGGAFLRLDRETHLLLISSSLLELEQGAVYFDSGEDHAASTSLEIRTRMGIVRDRGTQFEIRVEARAMRVSVREGTASLMREDQSYEAGSGTRLSVDERGVVETRAISREGTDWDWVLAIAPAFDLEGKTLGEFLDWVSSETGWEVRFAEPSIAGEAFTVTLHGSVQGMRPDQAPAAVLPTCGLSSHMERGILTVARRAPKGMP